MKPRIAVLIVLTMAETLVLSNAKTGERHGK
jgi:hypothetical protein